MRTLLAVLLAPLLFLSCSGSDDPGGSAGSSPGGSSGQGAGGAQAGSSAAGAGTGGSGAAGAGPGGAGTGGASSGGPGQGGSAGGSGGAAGAGQAGQGGASGGQTQGGFGSAAHQASARYFPDDAVWYRDATKLPKRADSGAITSWMKSFKGPHGFGTGVMKIDFSIVAVEVPAGTPKRTYELVEDAYYQPDCDRTPVPIPMGGAAEGHDDPTQLAGFAGYECPDFDGGADCHMLLVDRSAHRLYELFRATIDSSGTFRAGCLALWDTSQPPGPDGRGQQCTSADAAGFAMAPMMATPEEVKAGAIEHALRLILPNTMIRQKQYVAPATHGTNTTGPDTSAPYGSTFRLRADYPVATLKPAAQVVARALQKYGMLIADGGNIALTFQSDVLSTVKWADLGLESNDLNDLDATDFDVLDTGPSTPVTYDCQRTPILEP